MESFIIDFWIAGAALIGIAIGTDGLLNSRIGELTAGLAVAAAALLPGLDWPATGL